MFVIRGKNGEIITSTDENNQEREISYETQEQAEKALEELERSLPRGIFRIKDRH